MPETDNTRLEVTPGTTEFDKMVFKLLEPVNKTEIKSLELNGEHFNEVQNGVFVMPAIMDSDFNLFFLVSQLIGNDWIIAFSEATIENQIDVTDFSEPMTTGEGLNQLGAESPIVANQILDYFSNLAANGKGEWKMIK
ncbi:hypothetical protein ACQW5G_07340 [Fructilactobacillus sp. Tb1]|uniref:hypothetical protein n=1 Tax=Fructilactobacillus sp. Tb1 TaxID=3422304 RepID=UPI003D2668DE